jgi:hypothetical protein
MDQIQIQGGRKLVDNFILIYFSSTKSKIGAVLLAARNRVCPCIKSCTAKRERDKTCYRQIKGGHRCWNKKFCMKKDKNQRKLINFNLSFLFILP